MKMTIEELKQNVIDLIEEYDYSIEDALTHPDIGEDLCRVAYAEVGSDFDTDIYFAMPDDELIDRTEKICETVKEMLKAGGLQ